MEVINNIIQVTELFGTIILFHNFVKDFHERHNTSPVEAYLNSLGNLFGEGGDYHQKIILFIKKSLKNVYAFNEMFQLKKEIGIYAAHVSDVEKKLFDVNID